ncbi:hypothetical protein ACDW_22660 [Acidovorax sp. DW039]|uniref:hypothetical protein n=1 Tax=Acidovorax sp. DW039 TaxID=3095606 RepID=UPI003091F06D|nr:hypothetical protein ACDW_22660 [Acidovorax sp. DW039]
MPNLFAEFKALMEPGRVQVGEVISYVGGVATVTLPGGGQISARGQANVGGKFFVQEGVIQGPAPNLPIVVDEI